MAVRPVLRLIRLPNLFTAPADALAGWYLATGAQDPGQGALVGLASVSIYLGGIVLNDLCDVPIDREERPDRPLPSGEVSKKRAWGLVVAAFPVGLALGFLAGGLNGLLAALFLALLVVLYNGGLKGTWLGPLAMGLCRGTNALMGASPGIDYGYPWAWGLAAAITLYVAGITCLSRSEARGGGRLVSGVGLALQTVGLVGLVVLSRLSSAAGEVPEGLSLFGLVMLLATAYRVWRGGLRGVSEATPAALQEAVRKGVLSLSWLHAGVVMSAGGLAPALVLVGLSVAGGLTARRLYVT